MSKESPYSPYKKLVFREVFDSESGVRSRGGTPVAGTTNVIIGNNSGATRTFDGLIPMLQVFENVLTLEQITQIWSSTRSEIQ
jgi:hypothetical protein